VIQLDSLAASDALAVALTRQSPRDRRAPERPAPQSPAEVLAALLDFSGSVALAELLTASKPQGRPHADAHHIAHTLDDSVRPQLDAVSARALKRLAQEPATASAHPPAALLERIERLSPAPNSRVPSARAAARLARELGGPLHAALATAIRRAQGDVAALRTKLAADLRALGPRADRLERIDAALQLGIQAKLTSLFDRLVLAAELSFEHACIEACAALPEDFTVEHLASWSTSDGWIEKHRERCARMLIAFCSHLQRPVEGLLQAAIQAEMIE
jgi:hypothetical protein